MHDIFEVIDISSLFVTLDDTHWTKSIILTNTFQTSMIILNEYNITNFKDGYE